MISVCFCPREVDSWWLPSGSWMHWIEDETKSTTSAWKLDMEKAYDSVHWACLGEVIICMGFGQTWRETWCDRISFCVSFAKISMLVNGSPKGFFNCGRGHRIKHRHVSSIFRRHVSDSEVADMIYKCKSWNTICWSQTSTHVGECRSTLCIFYTEQHAH